MAGYGHKHTGRIHHADHTSHIRGTGKKDPHASANHHKMNAEHGMHHGFSHSDDHGGHEQHGGEGMAGNCSYS
jgi:hypothetical protein